MQHLDLKFTKLKFRSVEKYQETSFSLPLLVNSHQSTIMYFQFIAILNKITLRTFGFVVFLFNNLLLNKWTLTQNISPNKIHCNFIFQKQNFVSENIFQKLNSIYSKRPVAAVEALVFISYGTKKSINFIISFQLI